jgi:hypothetical protein
MKVELFCHPEFISGSGYFATLSMTIGVVGDNSREIGASTNNGVRKILFPLSKGGKQGGCEQVSS